MIGVVYCNRRNAAYSPNSRGSKNDLLIEKRADRTVSLEVFLKMANDKIETFFTNLNELTQHIENGKSINDSLIKRIERLEEEQLMLSEKREISDRIGKELENRSSLDPVTIQSLRTDAASKAALISQLQTHRVLSATERTRLI